MGPLNSCKVSLLLITLKLCFINLIYNYCELYNAMSNI
jgi:hypothetical protein